MYFRVKSIPELAGLDPQRSDQLLKESTKAWKCRFVFIFFITYMPVSMFASWLQRNFVGEHSFYLDLAFGMLVTLPIFLLIFIPASIHAIRKDVRSYIAIHGVGENAGDA